MLDRSVTSSTSEASVPYEGTPLWAAVEQVLDTLGGATPTDRPDAIRQVCERLVAAGVILPVATQPVAGSRAAFAAFLDRLAAAKEITPEWADHAGTSYPDGVIEEARRQASFVRLRLEQGGISAEQASAYFRSLARGLRDRAR